MSSRLTPSDRCAPPGPAPAPSAHQAAVFAHVERAASHAVVMATAGSGKTTTLVEVARRLPPGTTACFLAFNRATAAELRLRLPATTAATTIHALGRAAIVRGLPGAAPLRLEPGKYGRLASGLAAGAGATAARAAELARYLGSLARFARLELTDASDTVAVAELARRYGLERPFAAEEATGVHAMLAPLLALGTAAAADGAVDFTDMVYVPLTLDLRLEAYDFVCVDEAQDLSRLTLELVLRLVAGGARALFVGDERQAIYAFAGADRRSLARVAEATVAALLPLSVSFRCPTRHVALARRFAPEMSAAPGATAGSVRLLPERALPRVARPGDLVLSRTNAPLVGTALALAGGGLPTTVLGDDLAEELLELAGRVFPVTTRLPEDAALAVERHGAAEAARLEEQHLTHPALPRLLERSADLHSALALVLGALQDSPAAGPLEGVIELWRGARRSRTELEAAVRRLFEPGSQAEAVVLSTIHKAKGREAERVFLLRPEELAVGSADAETEAVEANVLFVALTRARRELVLVERRGGALAARLRARARRVTGPASAAEAALERRWDEVLSLAAVMARADGHRGVSWSVANRPRAAGRAPRSSS